MPFLSSSVDFSVFGLAIRLRRHRCKNVPAETVNSQSVASFFLSLLWQGTPKDQPRFFAMFWSKVHADDRWRGLQSRVHPSINTALPVNQRGNKTDIHLRLFRSAHVSCAKCCCGRKAIGSPSSHRVAAEFPSIIDITASLKNGENLKAQEHNFNQMHCRISLEMLEDQPPDQDGC